MVPRSSIRIHWPGIRFGDEVRYGRIRWPKRDPKSAIHHPREMVSAAQASDHQQWQRSSWRQEVQISGGIDGRLTYTFSIWEDLGQMTLKFVSIGYAYMWPMPFDPSYRSAIVPIQVPWSIGSFQRSIPCSFSVFWNLQSSTLVPVSRPHHPENLATTPSVYKI
jgi:hypothetical protein